MSLLIDTEFLLQMNWNLKLFKKQGRDSYLFRCPLCGDSKKSKSKTRGCCYKSNKGDKLNFKCHNCNEAMGFYSFIKRVDPELFKEYQFANIKFRKKSPPKIQQVKKEKPIEDFYVPSSKLERMKNRSKNKKYTNQLVRISELPDNHPAKDYIINRKTPEEFLSGLYFCTDFVKFVNGIIPGKFKRWFADERIILPLISSSGEWFGFQGRSIDKNVDKRFRFFTIIFNDEYKKIYGSERVDIKSPITIVEGPFDSLFIDNCIAACGASIDTIEADVYMLDNEPRNKYIVKIMEKLLKVKKKKVVILSDKKFLGKDVNDLILEGYSKEYIKDLIKNNTYCGLQGLTKLKQWSNI